MNLLKAGFGSTLLKPSLALSFSRNKSMTEILDIDTPIVKLSDCHRFISDCMVAVQTPKDFANTLADNLVAADYRGHYSHGLNRLDMYVRDVQNGLCDCKASPCILKNSAATAWMDGNNGLGAVIGKICMDLAIKKAKEVGIGLVSVKGSNHFGIAGMYALQALEHGLLGMSFTNTSPLMTPTRARTSALGTNPLALGAPGCDKDSFLLDMATTAVSVGKIEMQRRKNEPIPVGWALDDKGQITTDPHIAYSSRRLMPLGGLEENSGYKGTGLGFLVEIFSGILSGGSYGMKIRQWGASSDKTPANLGQSFIALDPECFAPGFQERLSDLMKSLRDMEPVDPCEPVLVAGDPERLHMKSVDESGGVRYVKDQHDTCRKLSELLKVKPLVPFMSV